MAVAGGGCRLYRHRRIASRPR